MLVNTDYHVIKEAEDGYSVPQEIIDERQDARNRINVLEAEIEQLKSEEEDTAAGVEDWLN
jgi:rRNA maturation endonuclease Nob1